AQEDGVIRPILEKLGVRPESARRDVEAALTRLPQVSGAAARLAMAEKTQKLFEQAFDEAGRLKDDYVSSEHLLLALASVEGQAGYEILKRHGVTKDKVIEALRAVR